MEATNIYFVNGTDGNMNDATQFDTTDRAELAELWLQFCIDEKIIEGVEEVEIEDMEV